MVALILFFIAYTAIVAEEWLDLDKTVPALLGGVGMWACIALSHSPDWELALGNHLSSISEILLFLLGAMTIVELIDLHQGFDIIAKYIRTNHTVKLLFMVAFFTFFLSSILDNLTASIVMMSVLRRILTDENMRKYFGGIVIIAANAGGVWSPIGDVTTTMLWTDHRLTVMNLILHGFFPAFICMVVPTAIAAWKLSKKGIVCAECAEETDPRKIYGSTVILITGLISLILVPLIHVFTGLPPFMGMLFSLAMCWLVSEILDTRREHDIRDRYTVHRALQRISISSILFFCGILLCIAALEQLHFLQNISTWIAQHLSSIPATTFAIGLVSAIVDNVPLVAATMGMYSTDEYVADSAIWQLLAYTAGTGGSILIIGSAAGVAVMSTEKISFGWYFKNIGWLAFIGYVLGVACLLVLV